MTDTATIPPADLPLADLIADRLAEALSPAALTVTNDSHHHAGHMGDDGTGETHFSVDIVADAFTGQSRVARQRLVNRALADLRWRRASAR